MERMREIVDDYGAYILCYEGYYIDEEVYVSRDYLFYDFFELIDKDDKEGMLNQMDAIVEEFEENTFYIQKHNGEYIVADREVSAFINKVKERIADIY